MIIFLCIYKYTCNSYVYMGHKKHLIESIPFARPLAWPDALQG